MRVCTQLVRAFSCLNSFVQNCLYYQMPELESSELSFKKKNGHIFLKNFKHGTFHTPGVHPKGYFVYLGMYACTFCHSVGYTS